MVKCSLCGTKFDLYAHKSICPNCALHYHVDGERVREFEGSHEHSSYHKAYDGGDIHKQTYDNKRFENKVYENRSYENKSYENKIHTADKFAQSALYAQKHAEMQSRVNSVEQRVNQSKALINGVRIFIILFFIFMMWGTVSTVMEFINTAKKTTHVEESKEDSDDYDYDDYDYDDYNYDDYDDSAYKGNMSDYYSSYDEYYQMVEDDYDKVQGVDIGESIQTENAVITIDEVFDARDYEWQNLFGDHIIGVKYSVTPNDLEQFDFADYEYMWIPYIITEGGDFMMSISEDELDTLEGEISIEEYYGVSATDFFEAEEGVVFFQIPEDDEIWEFELDVYGDDFSEAIYYYLNDLGK